MLHHFSYLKTSSLSDVFTGSALPPTNFKDSAFMLHHFSPTSNFLYRPMSSLTRLHRQQTSKTQHSCFITSATSKLLHFPMSSLARLHRQQTLKTQHSSFITSPTSKLLHFPMSSLARLYRQQTSKTQHSCFITSLLL